MLVGAIHIQPQPSMSMVTGSKVRGTLTAVRRLKGTHTAPQRQLQMPSRGLRCGSTPTALWEQPPAGLLRRQGWSGRGDRPLAISAAPKKHVFVRGMMMQYSRWVSCDFGYRMRRLWRLRAPHHENHRRVCLEWGGGLWREKSGPAY